MRSAQRCLDAKSFLHYANDAYTPYEILHVIGFGQDHFLPSNEKGVNARGREADGRRIVGETGKGVRETKEERNNRLLSFFASERICFLFSKRPKKDPRREIDYQKG